MTDASRLRELQDILGDGTQDVAPMITEAQVRPKDGEVVVARSQPSMERASLAIIHAASQKGSKADILGAMGQAGLNPEMFMQMTDSPDFWPVFKGFVKRTVYLSRYVGIQLALSERALAGDPRAAKELRESFDKDESESWDDFTRSLLRAGDETLIGESEKLAEDLKALLAELKTPPEPIELKQGILEELVLGSGERVTKTFSVDLAEMELGEEESK